MKGLWFEVGTNHTGFSLKKGRQITQLRPFDCAQDRRRLALNFKISWESN